MSEIKFDINELRKWQQEGDRSVSIELGKSGNKNYTKVWCYDYDLQEGQHIEESVKELNLIDRAIERAENDIERLKKLKGAM